MSKETHQLLDHFKREFIESFNVKSMTVLEAKKHLFEFMENKLKDLEPEDEIEIKDISTEEDYYNNQIRLDININRDNQ